MNGNGNENGNENNYCSICLESFSEKNFHTFINCTHGLCLSCYEQHVDNSNECPVCRCNIQDQNSALIECLKKLQASLDKSGKALTKLRHLNFKDKITQINSRQTGQVNENNQQDEHAQINTLKIAVENSIEQVTSLENANGLLPARINSSFFIENMLPPFTGNNGNMLPPFLGNNGNMLPPFIENGPASQSTFFSESFLRPVNMRTRTTNNNVNQNPFQLVFDHMNSILSNFNQ